MSEVRVRNLEEWVVEEFRRRARRNGRSMEAELREFLSAEAGRRRREMVEEMRALREKAYARHHRFADSTQWIREDRDERG